MNWRDEAKRFGQPQLRDRPKERPPIWNGNCHNCHVQKASGLFEVVYKNPRIATKVADLCAACGFAGGLANKISTFTPKDSTEPVFYHPVESVTLIRSHTTDYTPPPEKEIVGITMTPKQKKRVAVIRGEPLEEKRPPRRRTAQETLESLRESLKPKPEVVEPDATNWRDFI